MLHSFTDIQLTSPSMGLLKSKRDFSEEQTLEQSHKDYQGIN